MATQYAETVSQYRPLIELIPSHWQSGSFHAEDGTAIHFTRTGGDKPALLLLHGVQVNGLTWLRTAQAFEATHDVIMPDFRGHGKTGGLENGVLATLLVSDMIALINGLGLDELFVVGHSMGADIAGRLAAAHGLRGVVLVDPALQNFMASLPPLGDELPAYMQPVIEAMQTIRTQPHTEAMLGGLRLLPPGTAPWGEADYVSYVEAQGQFDLTFYHYMQNLGYLFEEPQVIAQIGCPVLLLTARPMMPGANIGPGVAVFTDNWREGQHIHFDDSGHAIMFDQFERFIQALNDFMEAH